MMTMVVVVLCRFRQLVSKDAPQWGIFHFYLHLLPSARRIEIEPPQAFSACLDATIPCPSLY